ncbi:MAG: hypothetical protein OXR66_00755 [Candidatus Woesearchaeota archaeon]|nr:hypothetical protein [Candidatus Woesearchaeota archaeon]
MRWFLLLIMLVSCVQEIPLEDSPERTPPNPDTARRPDIPRADLPPEEPKSQREPPAVIDRPIMRERIVTEGATLAVALGEKIGDHYEYLTARELPILKSKAVQLIPGLPLTYTEVFNIHNSTGRVIFSKDTNTDEIGSFLLFEDDEPIYTYELHLNEGTWYDLQGRDITVFGDTFLVAEVNHDTVHLYGRDVATNLIFEDGAHLTVGSIKQPHTDVTVDDHSLTYTIFTDGKRDTGDTILLSPGESLAENTNAFIPFDLTYKGLADFGVARLDIQGTKHGYRLIVENVAGTLDIPLIEHDAGELILGTKEHKMHISPCPKKEFCVQPDDSLLLTAPDGRNFLVWYSDVSEDPEQLIMRSKGNRYSYEYHGHPGDARTDIILEDVAFPTFIGPEDNETGEYNISVAQGFYKDRVEIVLTGGFVLRLDEIVNNTLVLELEVPRERTHTGKKEFLNIVLSYDDDWKVSLPDVATFADEDTLDQFGLTEYGIFVFLEDNKRRLGPGEGDELSLLIPYASAHGVVSIR